MELKLLFVLLRRWGWLLIIGVIVGAAGGYIASQRQSPVYQATTKVMVIQPQQSSVTADINLSDQELTQTYIALLTTQPVLDAAAEQLGFPVSRRQVSAQQTSGTRLLEVTVNTNDPEQAALVANTLVDVLIERNNTLQSGRFTASEESLQAQITQVEEQINQLREDLSGDTLENGDDLRQTLMERMNTLRAETISLNQEIAALTSPSLSDEEQALLLAKEIELAQLNFALNVEENAYNSSLQFNPDTRDPEKEQLILSLQEQSLTLEQEIETIRTQALSNDPQTLNLLAEKQATLAPLELELNATESQYLNLLTPGQTATGSSQTIAQDREETSLSLYQQLYANLLSTYESVRLARLQNTPDLVQVEEARPPGSPIQPRPLQNTLLGIAVGLLIMGVIAFLIEYLDDTIKTPEEISLAFGVPVIGFIADTGADDIDGQGVAVAEAPRSPLAEAFRALRTNLEFINFDKPLQTLLITSLNQTDGKTTVATNLAISLLQGGKKVVLVDADMRRPRVHQRFKLANQIGLSDIFLRDDMRVSNVAIPWETNPDLKIITSGAPPPNPTELLSSAKMDDILTQAKESGDIVIIDSPPLVVSDPTVLAAKVNGVLLVLQPGQINLGVARAAVEQFERANATIVGIVLNRIPIRQSNYYGGYYYAPYYLDQYNEYSDTSSSNGHGPKRRRSGRLGKALQRLKN